MFSTNTMIDLIQDGKKQWVNTFVQHEGIKTAMYAFIEGQTAYTKSATKVAAEVSSQFSEEATKAFTDLTKFDIAKFVKSAKK